MSASQWTSDSSDIEAPLPSDHRLAGIERHLQGVSSIMAASDSPADTPQEVPVTSGFWALTLGSIGVVFGDIGTSPLYAFREAVHNASNGGPVSREIVLGGSR